MFVLSIMQRPLKTIAKRSGDVYIPRGVSVPALDKDILWEFEPKKIGIFLPLTPCHVGVWVIFVRNCTFIIDDSAHNNISGARRGRYLNRWRSVCCKFDRTEFLLKKFVESFSKTVFKYLPLYLNLFLILSFRRTSLKTA